MIPRDYALQIEPSASAERLHEIETIIHKIMADELSRARRLIEDDHRHFRINSVGQAIDKLYFLSIQHANQT